MSQQAFDSLRRKKGFKTKRKTGATKKPGPEAEDIVALSGAELPEAPAPALAPLMEQMTKVLSKMEANEKKPGALTAAKQAIDKQTDEQQQQKQAKIKRVKAKRIATEEQKQTTIKQRELDEQERVFAAARNREIRSQELTEKRELDEQERIFAAKRNKEARSQELQAQIQHKSTMESLKPKREILPEFTDRAAVSPKEQRTPWKHIVSRNDLGRMTKVVSSNDFGMEWTHIIERSKSELIKEIVSIPS